MSQAYLQMTPALNPLRRVFVFIFNAFEDLDGAGIESKILK